MLSAVCWVESRHRAEAVHYDDNGANSVGACQIRLATARVLGFKGSEQELRLPARNLYLSGLYLRFQLARYHGDILKAISAYNAGTVPLNGRGQIRNARYVKAVLRAWEENR